MADVETNAMIEGVSLGIALIELKYTPVRAKPSSMVVLDRQRK